MLNLRNPWKLYRFIIVALVVHLAPLSLASAQVPAFSEPEASSPTSEPEVQPFFAPGVIRPAYILGPGDQVEITVFEYEEFTGARVILPDGTITLPVIGAVRAVGQTPEALAQELTARLQSFLINPVVTVSLNILRPVLVNVAGEVQRPGPVQLRSLTTTTLSDNTGSGTIRASLEGAPTVSSALVEAGGLTRDADIRQVVLRRSLPGENSTTVTVNLWEALRSEDAPQDLVLQDGDSIFVPRLSPNDAIDRRLIARSSLSPDTVRVRVVGEVKEPGEVPVPPNSSISSAVAIAGGPTVDAKLSRVTYIRLNEEGGVERQELDLSDLNDNFQIQEGDVIIVPKKNTSSILDFAARLLGPFNFLLDLVTE